MIRFYLSFVIHGLLVVGVVATLSERPQPVSATVGDTIELRCRSTTTSVTWEHDGSRIFNGANQPIDTNYHVNTSSLYDLIIHVATTNYGGIYTCTDPVESASATVIASNPPTTTNSATTTIGPGTTYFPTTREPCKDSTKYVMYRRNRTVSISTTLTAVNVNWAFTPILNGSATATCQRNTSRNSLYIEHVTDYCAGQHVLQDNSNGCVILDITLAVCDLSCTQTYLKYNSTKYIYPLECMTSTTTSSPTTELTTIGSATGRRRRSTSDSQVQTLQLPVGDSLFGNCAVVGTPMPDAEWIFCSNSTQQCSVLAGPSSGSAMLNVTIRGAKDAGIYSCVATYNGAVEYLWDVTVTMKGCDICVDYRAFIQVDIALSSAQVAATILAIASAIYFLVKCATKCEDVLFDRLPIAFHVIFFLLSAGIMITTAVATSKFVGCAAEVALDSTSAAYQLRAWLIGVLVASSVMTLCEIVLLIVAIFFCITPGGNKRIISTVLLIADVLVFLGSSLILIWSTEIGHIIMEFCDSFFWTWQIFLIVFLCSLAIGAVICFLMLRKGCTSTVCASS